VEIDFQDNTNSVPENHFILIKGLLNLTAQKENISENTEVSITFVNNDEI
jgi:probable rRNA maturation factor